MFGFILMIIIVLCFVFVIQYLTHIICTTKLDKPYDYVDFSLFLKEFNIRTKDKRCKYDKYSNVFEILPNSTYSYSGSSVATLSKTYISFSGNYMILINPIDYIKYIIFWKQLKHNYKSRNYKQGLFDRKEE